MRVEPSKVNKRPLTNRRQIAENLINRAEFLDSADRALLQAVFDRGVTAAEIARAIGERPEALRRRIQRLVVRLGSEPYQFVMRQSSHWPTCQRKVGESVFLKGLSQRETSELLGLSLHEVRREIERIRGLYDYQKYQHQQDSL